MKRTLLCFAVAVLMSVLPAGRANAQSVMRDIRIDSLSFLLDRASVQSATIYAAAEGVSYFLDSAQVNPSVFGTAKHITELTNSVNLTPAVEGTYVATVDASVYENSFIVFVDNHGVSYIVGDATDAANGLVKGADLFATPGDLQGPVVPMMGVVAAIIDKDGYRYTTFDNANFYAVEADTLTFLGDVATTIPLVISKSYVVMQNGHDFQSTLTDPYSITLALNSQMKWYGSGAMTSNKTLFRLQDKARLELDNVEAAADVNVVSVNDSAELVVDNSTLTTTATTDAIQLVGAANAEVKDVNFALSRNGVAFTAASTGALTIKEATVNNNMSGCAMKGVTGRAYTKQADNRIYRRTVKLASEAATAGDTLYVSPLAASISDTVANAVVVDFGGEVVEATLVMANTADSVVLRNAQRLTKVEGDAVAAGFVYFDGVDSVDLFVAGNHPAAIAGGVFDSINANPAAVALNDGYFKKLEGNIAANGGKYAVKYDALLAPRHLFVANTDADAASYPWKAAAGFGVRYMNHDAEGLDHDTIIVYNNADNKIAPRYNGTHAGSTDTILLNWYTDPSLESQYCWIHADGVLTSDTTLYPMWLIRNADASQYTYKVMFYRQNTDGTTYTAFDSTYGFVTPGSLLRIVPPFIMRGFHLVEDTVNMADFTLASGTDTVFEYHYDRNSYTIHWNLNGGTLATEPDSVFLYGQTIVYPDDPVRTGHNFVDWSPKPTQMPLNDFTSNALYEARICSVVWSGDASQVYTASPAVLSATFTDEGQTYDAVLNYVGNGSIALTEAVAVGTYLVQASAADTNFKLDPATTNFALQITPASLTASGAAADLRKTYDGTDTVHLTALGSVSPLGSDDVSVSTVARFDNATPGTGKTITAYYTLGGADMANYTLANPTEVIATNGEILPLIVIDEDFDNSDNGFDIDAMGYCGGQNAGIVYHLVSGNPVDYKLTFAAADIDEQGFVNVDWTPIATTNQIDIVVPATAAAGTYSVGLQFRNELGDSTAVIPVSFSVRMSKDFARPLFADVIAVVDTCHCLTNIQWYEDGVAVPGATGYYYQPTDHNLSGHTYHFTATQTLPDGTTQFSTTCEQDNVVDYVEDVAPTTVSIYPNPTADQATVSIEGSHATLHTLRLYNAMGVLLLNATFEGESTTLPLDGYGRGNYTLSVDGMPVRVIKK